MRGINIKLLKRRHLHFNRTLLMCVTTIARHNPEALALLKDVGEMAEKAEGLINFIGEVDMETPDTPVKPRQTAEEKVVAARRLLAEHEDHVKGLKKKVP